MSEDQESDGRQDSDSTGDPQLDRQVADLERTGKKVADRIEGTRSDWEAKKDDPSVPGAMADPAEADAAEEKSSDESDDPYEWVDEKDAGDDDGSDGDSDRN